MSGKLCLLCCHNFHLELGAAIAAEGWNDVFVADFPSRCGRPALDWDELSPLLAEDCTQVLVFGRACLEGLEAVPAGWPEVRLVRQQECFDLLAGASLVADAIARDVYLLTPGWLADWRNNLHRLGFDENTAAGFFQDFAHELLLLDTGVVPDIQQALDEFSRAAGLPASRLNVGIDHLRQVLARLVAEWRLEETQRQLREHESNYARELANYKAAMDFLGQLPLLKDERETVAAIEEMFHMLFAPQAFHYVPFENGMACIDGVQEAGLAQQVLALQNDWAWTDSQTGFLLRISRADRTLGVIAADRFEFPEFRDRYLNLALSVAGVAGLAIDNARTYRQIKKTEYALRKSERNLKIAQGIAHLGHWELNVASGEIHWSDETYRILGLQPGEVTPSYATFMQAIHPEDRERVEQHLKTAHDLEFRIILPEGRTRVLHCIGEAILNDPDMEPQIVATLRDITLPDRTQMLGVVQDITEQKELQRQLEQQARTDPLTGCANRRHFLELAEHEVARARRYHEDVSLLMLDLDHFKHINDRYGHPVGDLVLQRLVQVCQATLRAEDLVGRLGGEEFAVLLPESGSRKALEVGERLCRAVAAAETAAEGIASLRFTASIGVATLTQTDCNAGEVINRADKALYEAKRAGRNRVVAS